MVSGTITAHGLQQMVHVNNRHQVVDIPGKSSQIPMEQSIFAGTDNYFGLLMQACYVFSNNIVDFAVIHHFLNWVGLVAEMDLLKELFRFTLPTVIAVWENALRWSFHWHHGKAFEILIEIGSEVDNGRLIQPHYGMYFAMAIDMGSNKAMGSVSRLLNAGVSPNARFSRSILPTILPRPPQHHYWRCCALKQAAKNRDVQMLEHLLTIGNCRCGKFEAMCGNLLLSQVALSDPFTGQSPSLLCVEAIINSGIKVDFLPEDSESLVLTMSSLGWHRYGQPELLVDRAFFSDWGVNRDIYKTIACKSQWAQECVTVSGIFLTVEGGPVELRKYLDSILKPEPAMKEVLLQIALTEAAHCGAITVLECLLQYGVDPNVNTLITNLPEEEEEIFWTPVGRAALRWHADALSILSDYGADFQRYPLLRHVLRPHDDGPVSEFAMLEKRRGNTIQFFLDAGAIIDVPPALLASVALLPLKPSIWTIKEFNDWTDHTERFEPDLKLCDKLKQSGIEFDRGPEGCNILQTVIREGCNFATVSYLISNGAQVHSNVRSNRYDARYDSDYRYHRVKYDGEDATTMLYDALINACANRSKIVNILLENGADIYSSTLRGVSIIEASLYSVNESLYFLKDPYLLASRPKYRQKESIDIFWKLFQLMGAQYVYSLEFEKRSLFSHLIKLYESDDTILAGLDASGNLDNHAFNSGVLLLMDAIAYSRVTLVMRLVERGCNVNLRIDSLPRHNLGPQPMYNTPLQLACSDIYIEIDIIEYLLERGAEVNAPPTKFGMTALQIAAWRGHLGVVSTLLQHGAEINANAGTELHLTSFNKMHLAHMVTYHSVDMAALAGHLDVVHLLVGAGGLSGIPGVTSLDGAMVVAKKSGHNAIVEYLERHTGHSLTEEMRQAFDMPLSAKSDGTTPAPVKPTLT